MMTRIFREGLGDARLPTTEHARAITMENGMDKMDIWKWPDFLHLCVWMLKRDLGVNASPVWNSSNPFLTSSTD